MEPEVAAAKRVAREETPVMFLCTADELPEMRRAWARFEDLVGLRGRKFYGAFHPATKEYHVCAELRDNDDPAALGLESGALPGGAYLRARLRGEPPAVYERIGPTFVSLSRLVTPDDTGPSIEFYRRRDEIDLLLPVPETAHAR